MLYDIFFILFLLISICSTYILYFALKRINEYENLIVRFQQLVSYSTEHMKRVDASGHYEADDETGFFFDQLKELQLMLNDVFETIEEDDGVGEKEKE